jgi:hypothetical protein
MKRITGLVKEASFAPAFSKYFKQIEVVSSEYTYADLLMTGFTRFLRVRTDAPGCEILGLIDLTNPEELSGIPARKGIDWDRAFGDIAEKLAEFNQFRNPMFDQYAARVDWDFVSRIAGFEVSPTSPFELFSSFSRLAQNVFIPRIFEAIKIISENRRLRRMIRPAHFALSGFVFPAGGDYVRYFGELFGLNSLLSPSSKVSEFKKLLRLELDSDPEKLAKVIEELNQIISSLKTGKIPDPATKIRGGER